MFGTERTTKSFNSCKKYKNPLSRRNSYTNNNILESSVNTQVRDLLVGITLA